MADGRIVCRKFFLTIDSAENLPNVRQVFRTRAYAEVSIGSADKKIKSPTPVDNHNGLNPVWNHAMAYDITESGVLHRGLSVVIKVYCERTLGDRLIGEVHTTMKDLFDYACGGHTRRTFPIIAPGIEQMSGFLHISFSFGERFSVEKSDFMERVMDNGGVRVLAQVAAPALVQTSQAIVLAVLPQQ